MGRQLILVRASTESEIDEAFATIVQQRSGPLSWPQTFLSTRHDQLIALAARRAMPTIYFRPDAVIAGGLLSYGIDLADSYRQVGGYIGRILKGAKPGELPVLQPTKFLLAVNLRTAKGTRPRSAAGAARPRPRGDRVKRRDLFTLDLSFVRISFLTAFAIALRASLARSAS